MTHDSTSIKAMLERRQRAVDKRERAKAEPTEPPSTIARRALRQRAKADASLGDSESGPAKPGPKGPNPHADQPVGYRVEQNGQWFSLMGPDGEKVGKSQRSYDEAFALIPGSDGDD